MINVELQCACETATVPLQEDLGRWAEAAVRAAGSEPGKALEIVVRVVDEPESRELNRHYRGFDRPTNVLAFPAEPVDLPGFSAASFRPLGDLAVCSPVVEREAREQGKSAASHWAHMLVHGTLHLLGYDHQTDAQARDMERLEIQVLHECGFENPYEDG